MTQLSIERIRSPRLDNNGINKLMSEQTSDQKISELLERISVTQAALVQAQAEYDLAKSELESSPLLASVGLQVIKLKKGGSKKPWSEERRRAFSIATKKRLAEQKKAKK